MLQRSLFIGFGGIHEFFEDEILTHIFMMMENSFKIEFGSKFLNHPIYFQIQESKDSKIC